MSFFVWMGRMQPLSRYVLTRCILLACALLASALVVLVWAGESSLDNVRLFWYAGQVQNRFREKSLWGPSRHPTGSLFIRIAFSGRPQRRTADPPKV